MKKKISLLCKVLSVFLAIILVFQMVPAQIIAEAYEDVVSETADNSSDVPSGETSATEQEPEVVAEEISKREQNVKHFRMDDGTYKAVQYDGSVHFMLNDEWTDYDNTLTEVDADEEENENKSVKNKDLKNTLADYSVRLSKKTNGKKFVRIEKDGYKLSWYYTNANKVTAKITETADDGDDFTLEKISSKVVYEDVYENTDFEYIVSPDGLKENIILQKAGTQTVFEAEYKVDKLSPVQVDSKTINLVSANGEVVYTISAPYMTDSNNQNSPGVTLTLSAVDNNKFTVTTTLDENWLNDDSRVYPVTVDPMVMTKPDPATIDNKYLTTNSSNLSAYGSMYVGKEANMGQTRSAVKFTSIPTLDKGDMVCGAVINLAQLQYEHVSNTQLQINAYEITSAWSGFNNSAPGICTSTNPVHDDKVLDYVTTTASNNYTQISWNITPVVKKWYNNPSTNHGIFFAPSDTRWAYVQLAADFNNIPNSDPLLIVSYINNRGLEDYWSYTEQNLGTGVGYVNNATGNLVVNIPICDTSTASLPASISYYYNGYQAGRHFAVTQGGGIYNPSSSISGAGWKLNVDEQLAYLTPGLGNNDDLHAQGFKYTYTDSDGTVLYMKETSSGSSTFEDELGKGYKLTLSGSEWTLTDKQNNKKTFTSGGRLKTVQTNQSYDTITYNYDDNMFLEEIVDGSGHKITINRNSNNAITSIIGSLGEVKFNYSGSWLVKITYPDGGTIHFDYDSDYRLTSVTSRDGTKINYTYPTTGDVAHKNRVVGVTEYSAPNSSNIRTVGNSLTFDYNHGNYTKVTDNKGRSVVYNFDNCGRTMSAVDDLGATSTKYTSNVAADNSSTGQYVEQNNKITSVSSSTLPVDNLLKNHSFENGTNNWYIQTSCISSDSSTALIGAKSVKMSSSTTNNNTILYQYYTPAKTGEYTFSFYYKTTGLTGNSGGIRAMLQLKNSAEGTSTYISCPYIRESTNGEWVRASVTANVTSEISEIVAIIGFQYTIGTAYFDCAQLEYGPSANRYNLVENGSFTQGSYGWTAYNSETGDSFNTTQGSIFDTNNECPEYITHGAFVHGNSTKNKSLYQNIQINMPANQVALQFSGFACGESVPKSSGRYFALDLKFCYSDGTSQYVVVDFNYDSTTWQYVSQLVMPSQANQSKTVSYVTVYFLYYQNQNWACFTGMNLNIDKTGVVYSYDSKGNLVSAKDMADRDTVAGIDDVNRMTGYTDEENSNYTYTYNTDNTSLGTTKYQLAALTHTDHNLKYEFTYDKHGNVIKTIKSSTKEDSSAYPMRIDSEYSESGDILLSTTDSLRNKVEYGYEGNDLRVSYVKQNNKRINYIYAGKTNLVREAWSEFTAVDGTSRFASNYYVYENDRIKSITHNGFSYNFTYDNFGNRLTTSVGNRLLMTNQYGANNGLLTRSTYGNGHYVENEYDYFDRITGVKYNGTKLFSYVYNSDGLVNRHIDNVNNKTYNYNYDMLGRLQRMDITGGNSILYKYNNLNQVTGTTYNFNGVTKSSTYTYDKGSIPKLTTYPNNATKAHGLNDQAQLDETVLTTTGTNQWETACVYYTAIDDGVSYTTNLVGDYTFKEIGRTISYTYDGSGNIATKADTKYSTTDKIEYFYDKLNQLIRENDPVANKTITYVYDDGGNILEKREYDYTTSSTLGTPTKTITYTYDAQWKDLLTSYDGKTITYDAIGNPLTFDGATLTWERGRKLSTMSLANGSTASYKYNADGIRTQKTVGGVTTDYFLEGSTIVAQKTGNDVIWYYFDGDGTRDAIEYDGDVYYYMYNPQGDVIGLFDENLNVVVEYTYDSWGNVSITGSRKDNLGKANPFRYRGYYYDEESGMYYLNSRYYHPEIGRFINADGYVQTGQGILDKNMFAYCMNNPVNYVDPYGNCPYNGTAADFHRLEYGLPSLDCTCGYSEPSQVIYSNGQVIHIYKSEDDANNVYPLTKSNTVRVVDYRSNRDSNIKILDSYKFDSPKIQNIILTALVNYNVQNPSTPSWNRTIDSMLLEWDIHNVAYNFGISPASTAHVDLNNNDEGKGWLAFIWERGIKPRLPF